MSLKLLNKIRIHRICIPDDDLLVIGSDGIFDATSIQELSKIIRSTMEVLSSRKGVLLKEIKSEPDIKTQGVQKLVLRSINYKDKSELISSE